MLEDEHVQELVAEYVPLLFLERNDRRVVGGHAVCSSYIRLEPLVQF